MNMCCYNRCLGNAVKGFWGVWLSIYVCVCSLLYIFPSFLTASASTATVTVYAVESRKVSHAPRALQMYYAFPV
jgi:hypothetical protein